MAFDRNYPVTNSTPWNTLYAGLRSQFTALDDLTDDEIAWTDMTLVTGWIAYGGGYDTPRYSKDGFGFVHLRGLTSVNTGATPGQLITTLPAACIPKKTVIVKMAYDVSVSTTTATYYYIDTSGEVRVNSFTPAQYDQVWFNCVYYHVGG